MEGKNNGGEMLCLYAEAKETWEFVINHSFCNNSARLLNLTNDYNLIAVFVYVAYRKPFPNKETVNMVKKLKKNNIE